MSVMQRHDKPAIDKHDIAHRLCKLADDMDAIAALMDYYGEFAELSRRGIELAAEANIARQLAMEIDTDGETER